MSLDHLSDMAANRSDCDPPMLSRPTDGAGSDDTWRP
jgi:hypothetical protein